MGVPAGGNVQIFLLRLPMGRSSLSVTMHTSSIRRICSASWPERASLLLSMSGNSWRMVSAVITGLSVTVVVVDILKSLEETGRPERHRLAGALNGQGEHACTHSRNATEAEEDMEGRGWSSWGGC